MVVDVRPLTKLSSYAVVLVAVLGGGAAVGAAVGPIDIGGETAMEHDEAHEGSYTIVADSSTLGPRFGFVVTDASGDVVDDFDVVHDKELHLVVASQDLRQFAHVHPSRDDHGHWTVDLPTLPPGPYRVFADFRPSGGTDLVLPLDVVVPGTVAAPQPLTPSSVATVDGFEVTLDGHAEPGATSTVTVTVRRDGEVVTTAPYLGAAGHLVALRSGDLAYLHVHPIDDEPSGPVRFGVEVPSAGTYALFFDFLVDGTVHTAPFVLEVGR